MKFELFSSKIKKSLLQWSRRTLNSHNTSGLFLLLNKRPKISLCFPMIAAASLASIYESKAATVLLTGTSYSENFDGIGSSPAAGFDVRTGATSTSLGTIASYTSTAGTTTAWSDSGGAFKNVASSDGLLSSSSTATQTSATDRALGLRATGAFGDVGAAFNFNFDATSASFSGATTALSLSLQMLSVQARSQTFTVQYGIGATPTTFTTLGTYPDPGVFGSTTLTFTGSQLSLLSGAANAWIRIVGLTASSGSGSRDTIGLDDFSLTYSALGGGTSFYWLGDDTVRGGAGIWEQTGGTSWSSTDADGTGASWDKTKTAVFGGTGASVAVTGTVEADAGITFNSSGYTLSGGTAIDLGGASNTITSAPSVTAIISTPITGTGGLTKAGSGTLIIDGASSYSGNTIISAGTLQIGNGGVTGEIAGSVINTGILAFNRSNDYIFAGNITGAGSVTKNGAGILTLSGVNSYGGGTTVGNGGLTGTTGSLQGGIVNNAAITFDQGGDGIYAGSISGSGSVTKAGAGVVTFSGTNSYGGGTTISAGGLIGTTASLQGAILNNAAITFDQGIVGTYAGDLTGSGTLAKSGAGTVTLSGTNSYSGGTTVLAGGLTGTTTSLQGNIANSGVVTFDQSSTGTYAGNLSGSGSLAKSGSGTLTLGGTNSHSGPTTVNAGTLVAGNASSLGSSVVTVKGGSLLADSGLTITNNIVADAVTSSAFTATYNFTAGNTVALTTGAGFTVIDLTRGNYNGIPTGSDDLPSTTSAAGTGSGTFNAPIAAVGGTLNTSTSAYFEFALDATTATSVTLNDISFLSRSTSSGPLAYTLRSSADGYTADIATGAFLANSAYAAKSNTGLGINGDLITYRLFGSGGSASASVTSSSSNWRIDDLVISGTTQTAGTATIGGSSSTGTTTYSGGVSLVSNAVLSAASGSTTAFTGVISGSGSITTSGGGQVTLSGANTYSGTTTISAGKLALGASNVIPGTQVVLSGGTLLTEGFSNATPATLKLSSGSIIDLSNNSSVLSFADSKGVAWTGALAIWNWSGSLTGGGSEQITFSAAGLTSEQLGAVTFLNPAGLDAGTYGAQFIGNELVPVPEVGALFGALGLLAPLAWRERRHWMRCREARVA